MHSVIDINCDIGERGMAGIEADLALLPFVSSVNVACGFHAGDPDTMATIVAEAGARGIAIGAHPGLPDRENFGRLPMALTDEQIYRLCIYQIGALKAIARLSLRSVTHIKPHGALYHMCEEDEGVADALVCASTRFGFIRLFGPAGGALESASRRGPRLVIVPGMSAGVPFAAEVYADRAYDPSGRLAPRGMDGAVIADPNIAAARIRRWLETGEVDTIDGGKVAIRADSICIHSDTPSALEIAQAVHKSVTAGGVTVAADLPRG